MKRRISRFTFCHIAHFAQAIHFAQAKRIQLSFAHPLPAQIDGERFHDNEVSVQVFPSELEVLMP